MKVLVVGSGGRECALVWKLSQSEKISGLFCTPGNGCTSDIATNLDISANDIEGLADFACKEKIDLTVVGSEEQLSAGIVDLFKEKGLRIFGPSKNAAIIEYSKSFSKDFMVRHGIPTAKYAVFEEKKEAEAYINSCEYPVVIKADGLAVGKGVYICEDFNEAQHALDEIMVQAKFGLSGKKIVIEEYLVGVEVSVLAFVDGGTVVPMISSMDHKSIYDGNKGPNTGGMGTVAPNSAYNNKVAAYCMENIFVPTVLGLKEEGREFIGTLFFGLMLTKSGPKVLEYNARFGDPETQVVLPMLENDLLDVLIACCDKKLDEIKFNWKNGAAVCVVLASGGYPGNYNTGFEISGIEDLRTMDDCVVFGAGVKKEPDGRLVTNGGRVLGVTALGASVSEASEKAYKYADKINFDNKYYRSDIGRANG